MYPLAQIFIISPLTLCYFVKGTHLTLFLWPTHSTYVNNVYTQCCLSLVISIPAGLGVGELFSFHSSGVVVTPFLRSKGRRHLI